MRHRQDGPEYQMDEMNILRDEEMTQMLITLAKQTDEQKIKWICNKYLSIAFHMRFPSTPEADADMSQSFEGEANFQGQTLKFLIHEAIYLPSEKGDIRVEISFLGEESAQTLSYDYDYEICPAKKIRKEYGHTPVVLFANAAVPVLVKENDLIITKCMQGKFFREEDDNPESLKRLSVVRTANRLCEEGRVLEFHRMILDTSYREQLSTK